MASVGTFTKITHLWRAHSSRKIDSFGLRKKPFQQQNKQNKQNKDTMESDETGKNIDEYV